MRKILGDIILGKSNKFNGLIALMVVCSIVLGCQCNKILDSAKKGSEDDNPPVVKKDDGQIPNSNPFGKNTTNDTTNPTNDDTEEAPTYTKADASKKQLPSDAEMQDMVKETLLDFNDAVKSEDFTEFHSNLSKTLQRQVTPEQVKQKFQLFIDGKMDISAISSMKADFTSPAKIIGRSLDVKGTYPTAQIKTDFELQYVADGKDWKLFQIKVIAPIKRR